MHGILPSVHNAFLQISFLALLALAYVTKSLLQDAFLASSPVPVALPGTLLPKLNTSLQTSSPVPVALPGTLLPELNTSLQTSSPVPVALPGTLVAS